MSLTQKFKKTNPNNEKTPPEHTRSSGSANYSLLKPGVTAYKFEEGPNLLRLLPQWTESPFPNFLDVNVLGFYDDMLPLRGTFRVTEENGWILTRMFKLLRSHPEFKHRLWSKENELGISFNPRPKVVFLGFNISDPEMKVMPIVLPGTVSYPAKDGKARIPQAGTRIAQFVYDTDIHGNLRHGDIFDVESGKVVRLDVTNAGTVRAKYDPIVDAAYPLTNSRFEKVLLQIKNFDEYVAEPTMEELIHVMSLYLPGDIYDYLDGQIKFDRVIESSHDKGNRSSTAATASVSEPKASSVPLPEDEEGADEQAEPDGAEASQPQTPEVPVDDVEERLAKLRKEMSGRKGTKR